MSSLTTTISAKDNLLALNTSTVEQRKQRLEGIYRETVDRPAALVELVEEGLAAILNTILSKEHKLPSTEKQDESFKGITSEQLSTLRPASLKLCLLVSENLPNFADETRRLLLDSLLGPLMTAATNTFDNLVLDDDLVAMALAAIRNCVLSPEGAVRFMLLGGIRILLEGLHSKSDKIVLQSVAGLANMALTDTVRDLIGAHLRERERDIRYLINMCKAKELPYAFFAASAISFLLMSEQNVSVLVGLRALVQLRVVCERDPLEEGTGFNFTKETAKRYCVLMGSDIPEVVCFFNWFVARFSSTNPMVNANEPELNALWRGHLAPVMKHFARNPSPRTRALAKLGITQFVDTEFTTMSNIESWLKTIDTLDANAIKKLLKGELENVDMDLLFDPDLAAEEIKALLDVKSPALKIRLWLSLSRYRKALDHAAGSLKSLSMSLSSLDGKPVSHREPTKQSPEAAEEGEQKKHTEVFISYSWFNKSAAHKIREFLESKGLSCWMDENMIDGGKQLFEEIDIGVSNAKVIVACVSNNYALSENCRREVRLAADRGKIVVPVIVGETKPWPPRGEMGPLLAGKLYVDMSTEEKFTNASNQLVRALERSM